MSRAENILRHYEALGLSRAKALTVEAVKKAYKKACLKYHPDVTKLDLEKARGLFSEVQDSYNALMFHLKKAGGELPANILTPAAFFSMIGMDELAEATSQNLHEINMNEAARSIGADDSDGAVSILDAKIMKKITFWARGVAGTDKIFDHLGHFSSDAVDNIIEMALYYKTAESDRRHLKRHSFFDELEAEDEKDDLDYSERMYSIISEWVHQNYTRIGQNWVHRTAIKIKLEQWLTKLSQELLKQGIPKPMADSVMLEARLGNFGHLEDVIKTVGATSQLSAAEKKASQAATRELKAIAKKAGLKLTELIDACRSGDVDENPTLYVMSERVNYLSAIAQKSAQKMGSSGTKRLRAIAEKVTELFRASSLR